MIIEFIGLTIAIILIVVELVILWKMEQHMKVMDEHTLKLDEHITQLDKHLLEVEKSMRLCKKRK